MKIPDRERQKLVEALRQAYQGKEQMEVGRRWRTGLKVRIREMGPLQAPGFLPSFERVVWRLAPVTSPLVILMLLFALSVRFDVGSSYDALQTLVNSVEELALSTIFAT